MGIVQRYIRRPQQVWLRKAMFQVHLWVGLFLALYAVVIGISGSILVFRQEFQQWTGLNPDFGRLEGDGPRLGFADVHPILLKSYPKARIGLLYPPREQNPVYFALIADGRKSLSVSVHPYSGKILEAKPPERNWMTWIAQLHFFLLMGRVPGFYLNGICSALLLVMVLSGMVIWWQGLSQWVRGFVVDFRRNWKRINFDLHNVTGFWTLAWVTMWAITGVYLVWPNEFTAAVDRVSKVSIEGARENRVRASANKTGGVHDLAGITRQAAHMIPGSHIGAISFPARPAAPLMLYMVRDGRETLSGADFIYFDPANGKHLKTSLRNNPKSFGDWIIWLQRPLHYGTQWGLAVKIIWFLFGLALPLLAVTGVLMYWNRYLSKKWKALRASSRPKAVQAEATPQPVEESAVSS